MVKFYRNTLILISLLLVISCGTTDVDKKEVKDNEEPTAQQQGETVEAPQVADITGCNLPYLETDKLISDVLSNVDGYGELQETLDQKGLKCEKVKSSHSDRLDSKIIALFLNDSEFKNCKNFFSYNINNNSIEIGRYGKMIWTQLRELGTTEQGTAHLNKLLCDEPNKEFNYICPNYQKMNTSDRAKYWIWYLAGLSFFESRCKTSIEGAPTGNVPIGNAIGLFQMEEKAQKGRPDCCDGDMTNPYFNICCAVKIKNQFHDGSPVLNNRSYFHRELQCKSDRCADKAPGEARDNCEKYDCTTKVGQETKFGLDLMTWAKSYPPCHKGRRSEDVP